MNPISKLTNRGARDATARGAGTEAPAIITTRLAATGPAGLALLLVVGSLALGTTVGAFGGPLSLKSPDDAIEMDAKAPSKAGLADAVADDASANVKLEAGGAPADEAKGENAKHADEPNADDVAESGELARSDATPKPQPTPKPADEVAASTPKPTAKATPKPAPAAPVTTTLLLTVASHEVPGKLAIGWSAYSGSQFQYYKLVRTTDGDPTWPARGSDEVIGAFGSPSETWTKDRPACGMAFTYRVFAVRKVDGAYQVLAPSNAVTASVECPPPPPATVGIGLEGHVAEGKVHLVWGACAVEGFNAYKVVRSLTNPEPMYPENAGTELIAAIGNPGETAMADASVESGQTWYYRVLARADNGHGHYIACQSPVLAVTIP